MREKGITLIALVVTIVILLIISSITISSITSNNGILSKKTEISENYLEKQNSVENETETIKNQWNGIIGDTGIDNSTYVHPTTVKDAKETQYVFSMNSKLKDENEKIVAVPSGFKVASDSATDRANGIVIEDKSGNQYVWIPVDNIADYKRTDFGKQYGSYSEYSETIDSTEQISVSIYKGFYIGRYEAGISTARSNASNGMESNNVADNSITSMADLGEILVKANVPSYTFVLRDQAKSLSQEIKTHYGYSATTKLCSSYAWDTALNFIDKTNSGYSTNSVGGIYSTSLHNTGSTDSTPKCNIYDLGGNVWEWTTEACSDTDYPCVLRGGGYNNDASDDPAGYRNDYGTTNTYDIIGFRSTLYL